LELGLGRSKMPIGFLVSLVFRSATRASRSSEVN
jgi:hypothetical protein